MILYYSETIRSVTYCALNTIMDMHSRDITLIIVSISCTTPACFGTFYRCAMVPTLVEISNFFVYLFVSFK